MEKLSRKDYYKYLDPSVISRIGSLEMRARYIVEGFLLGLHKSPYHGFSIEFSQYRQYMQGDSLKDIDWKIYGKTDRYYVKQYEEETNLRCHILLDSSKSMSYMSGGSVTKHEYGKMLAASLSLFMTNQNDAVGLVTYDESISSYLPPRASRIFLNEILSTLLKTSPDKGTNTSGALNSIAERMRKRGLVVIISDFFEEPEKLIAALRKFTFTKNEVIVFQVLDPAELGFTFDRDAIFKDMETGDEITTLPYQIRKSYMEAFDTFLEKMKGECLKYGIDYNLINTSQPFDVALRAFLKKRMKAG